MTFAPDPAAEAALPNPEPEPDLQPLRTLGLVAALHAANHAIGFVVPLVYLAIRGEFGVSVDTIAFLAAIGTLGSGFLQLFFSDLARYAPRRVLLALGGLVMGVATAAQAATGSFLSFAVANVIARLGGSPQHPVGSAILVSKFPPRRRGFAISAHVAGGHVGTVAVPIIGTWLIATQGWRTAVVIFGIPSIVVAIALVLFVRESVAERAAARAAVGVRGGIGAILRERDTMLLCLSGILGGGGRGLATINLFALVYLTAVLGVDATTAGLMYAAIIAFSIPAPLVAGWLSDRFGRRPVIVGVYLGGAVAFALFVLVGASPIGLWVAVMLMGVFTFAESPQLQAYLADTAPPPLRDVSFGVFFTLTFVSSSVWTAIYGAMIAVLGEPAGLPVVFWLMSAAFVVSAIVVLPVRARALEDR